MTTELVKLLPCPFCGGEAAHGTITYSDKTVKYQRWDQSVFHKVNCIHCGANNLGLVGHESPTKAAEKWNKRTTADRIEQLEAENAALKKDKDRLDYIANEWFYKQDYRQDDTWAYKFVEGTYHEGITLRDAIDTATDKS